MYFRKWPHPANFDFVQAFNPKKPAKLGKSSIKLDITSFENDVYRIRPTGKQWKKNHSLAGLTPPKRGSGSTHLTLSKPFGLNLQDAAGNVLLSSPAGMSFGICNGSSMYIFNHSNDQQFYGMGEKLLGLELSGVQTKFWNTDVFADFYWKEVIDDRPDPLYASIPYLIIKRDNTYVGLLLDNPHATFMSTGANINIANQMKLEGDHRKAVIVGCEDGQPDLYILVGPTLPELTRKLQNLVGKTPLPPAWALGYHQCRWGYRNAADLEDLDSKFRENGIPCDGLWLDIDYMKDFKVFTLNKEHFPNAKKTFKGLGAKKRKVIPILDPGVKRQPGYDVYDSGRKARIFCKNPQGRDFVGLVWPGETVFPDFSMAKGRSWWSDHVKKFASTGIYGAWIDMNDPSTGHVENTTMLFNDGKESHYVHHNQYALGMAMATRDGFQAAHPKKRPFVISRSGFTGISKYSAIWTGDNTSNYHYLRLSIPCSMNLALSGVPFNGPDIGGFSGDTTPQLITDWMKACFLFPFCRNHSMIGTRNQEPWAFDADTLQHLRHYIRMRYKLRPYLYNLFIQQENLGEAILRPLFYDFADTTELPLGRISDQFMIGPAVMQAPLLDEKEREREVVLPGKQRWYSFLDGAWLDGHQKVRVKPVGAATPMYVHEGSIIPMAPGEPVENDFDGSSVELHVFLSRSSAVKAATDYAFDDGETWAYHNGKRSVIRIEASVSGATLDITAHRIASGFGPCSIRIVAYDTFTNVLINGRPADIASANWTAAGRDQQVVHSAVFSM